MFVICRTLGPAFSRVRVLSAILDVAAARRWPLADRRTADWMCEGNMNSPTQVSIGCEAFGGIEPIPTTGSGLLIVDRLVLERRRALLICGKKEF